MEDRARTDEAPGVRGYLFVYLKGAFMGAADAVPGVSGGTIALIVGVYERLIGALTALDPRVLELVPRLHTRDGRTEFVRALVAMDVPFLVLLGTGVVTAAAGVSGVMHVAVTQHPVPTYSFFFGLIAASAVVLRDEVALDTAGRVAAGLVGFTLAFLVSGITQSGLLPTTLPVLFVAGGIAITAMILPGISGAFLLVLLGQYEFMSGLPAAVLGGVRDALSGDAGSLADPLAALVTFGVGAVIGLLTVAHAVRWALERYHAATLTFLVALMVGALRAPYLEVARATDGLTVTVLGTVAVAGIVGAGLVLGLDYVTDDIDY
ncbi:DUF368 domain-containing protein [Halorarius halobius]|uniref:DUF368 domain-containing protein n=1 Tax=Halorarius halobius TaxID=2962671 RepID=UPI0020CC82FF|nr:DUF368 domain-containing protein [Halorarius halobius]